MAKKMRLDFSKVEERAGWNTRQIPEGLHLMKVVGVEETEAGDGTAMWVYALVPQSERYAARRFPYYCKLQPNQLFKVRDLFVAGGIEVPKKAQSIDPEKVVGKLVAAEVVDEVGQYAGRSSVNAIYSPSTLSEDSPAGDDEEEYDEPEEGDEPEDEEEYEDGEDVDDEDEEGEEDYTLDELEAMKLAELRTLAKEQGLKTVKKSKEDLIDDIAEALGIEVEDEAEDEADDEDEDLDDELDDADLDDEELEDDEEEDEPAPAPKRRAPAPAKKAAPTKKAAAAAPAKRRVVRR